MSKIKQNNPPLQVGRKVRVEDAEGPTTPVQEIVEIKTNSGPVTLRKKIEKALRQNLIYKLTDKRAKMVAMYEFSSEGSFARGNEDRVIHAIESDMTFEPGNSGTMVRVLVKPNTPKSALIETLDAIIGTVSAQSGDDWMTECDEAVDKVAASLKRIHKR